ncbi:UvrABC system protein A [Anatilimnocola aggregata]|uniref:UvrABC system protein A n=1 Tax=Anatilimnocola aggregata TaxID=2528021 RepID=A0A517YCP1_9BACT|nr:excinuclease ABC subunit UvrA [Anatilimnocola aggregata]QDU27892.1 UvrABC system protein A [Anatilimnocola aggregata]
MPSQNSSSSISTGEALALAAGSEYSAISIRGARTHNLQNVDLDIPHGKLVVITGPSGSGKSSLAFDTVYAEGQRQYIESLSVYSRQFLTQLQRPDVDSIDGLQPTICIDQRPGNQNPRSTVATNTEIYDYLRLLMARLGDVSCHQCGEPVRHQSLDQIQEALLSLAEGTKLLILAPIVRGRKGQHAEALATVRKAGLVRARIDGQLCELDAAPQLDARKAHTIEAVVDRIVVRPGVNSRLAESLQLAARHGDGALVACYLDPEQEKQARTTGTTTEGLWTDRLFSTKYACPNCQVNLAEIEPRTFSFNSPYGACPKCEGLGHLNQFDPDLVVPIRGLSLASGVVAPWAGLRSATVKKSRASLEAFLTEHDKAKDANWSDFTESFFTQLLYGEPAEKTDRFVGLMTLLEQELATATDEARREQLEAYRGQISCQECGGSRLRREALGVRVAGKTIHEITQQSIYAAAAFFQGLHYAGHDQQIAKPILQEIRSRLGFLQQVGLGYLTLARSSDSLSGGEFQRVRLATGIGAGLAGILYILDEPSIGLHSRDNDRLIAALRDLQTNGSTVLVVEHDEAMMHAADWLIDIGPGAGSQGGKVIAAGTPAEVAADPLSLTGAYLSGRQTIAVPTNRRTADLARAITIAGCTANNLQNVTATIPLGLLIAVTGVSGSGKSSLINETLAPALIRKLGGVAPKPAAHASLVGTELIDKVIEIDQRGLGRSPRSNAATYTGLWDEIRKVFATTKEARQLGYAPNRFSFNVAGGRCETCQGQGLQRIEMNFLPDIFVPCPTCSGQRFNAQTLQVLYRGKNIAEILEMSIDEAVGFFENFSHIERTLVSLCDVGLGYLKLGQPSTTLSGGEAQRVKLATELARAETGRTFYLLDEPTTGLHFDDIRLLLGVLQKLVDRGNTVLVIEHNLDVIKSADWLIDLGPDGGDGGGQIMFAGTPEQLASLPENLTGKFLKPLLKH